MLRHSCGYYLASKGWDNRLIQDYLGHKQIQHTVKYTQLAPGRFDAIKWDWMNRPKKRQLFNSTSVCKSSTIGDKLSLYGIYQGIL